MRFVAREKDLGGVAALEVLKELGCFTALLNGDGTIDSRDVVFFTPGNEKRVNFPSKWLRTSPDHLKEVRPSWAEGAQAVIAVRPGKTFTEEGFETAILGVARLFMAVPKPPKKPRKDPPRHRFYGHDYGVY